MLSVSPGLLKIKTILPKSPGSTRDTGLCQDPAHYHPFKDSAVPLCIFVLSGYIFACSDICVIFPFRLPLLGV